jgi:hypothetical protein
MTPKEARAIMAAVPFPSSRMVMIGVLASAKTLRGLANRWPHRYPTLSNLAGIFPDHPLAFNLIHYNTNSPDLLYQQLLEITPLAGPHIHGYQLNIPWPPASQLRDFRLKYPRLKIVLQVSTQSLDMIDHSAEGLISKLREEYVGLVDYALLDPSAGSGLSLDPAWARRYLQALHETNLGIGMGVAGGLSPATLDLVEPLVRDFPELSIDAESLLRDENDDLNVDLAKAYIRRALELFKD